MKSSKYLIAVCTFLAAFASAHPNGEGVDSSTHVRNGGDRQLTRLETARTIMKQAIAGLLKEDPSLSHHGCMKGLSTLDKLCRNFFLEVAPQIDNPERPYIPLILSESPLSVKDPFTGIESLVSARTSLAFDGPIEFHVRSLKSMDMPEILFLLSHEFLHKVKYQGAFVADDAPFRQGIKGRTLIDHLATTIMTYAIDQGLLGRLASIEYHFSCSIKSPHFKTGVDFKLNRINYFDGEIPENFKVALGDSASDTHLYTFLDDGSRLEFRFFIFNRGVDSCNQYEGIKNLHMQVLKIIKEKDGSYIEDILKEKNFIATPLCSANSFTFGLDYEDTAFTCTFTDSSVRQDQGKKQ